MKKKKCYGCGSYYRPPSESHVGGCDGCERQWSFARAKARSAIATQDAEDTGLPKLDGSVRQIAWAHDIRKAAIADFATFQATEFTIEQLAIWNSFVAINRASWWIDNRVNFRLGNIKKFIATSLAKAAA